VLVGVLAVAFVSAGLWQLRRNEETKDELAEARRAFAEPAPAIADVDLDTGASANTRVTVTGTFDAHHVALLRNRSRDGDLGYAVLTPLRLDSGEAVIVDRGWVSFDRVAGGLGDTAVPEGTVVVRGVLRNTGALREGEEVQDASGVLALPRVDPAHVVGDAYDVLPAYVEAQYQDPAPASGAPALPEPQRDSSVNHVSYALQWFSFAAIVLIGWPIVLWRVARRPPRRAESGAPATERVSV
jgi:cytochrome oxidase assembly protein ShyY1